MAVEAALNPAVPHKVSSRWRSSHRHQHQHCWPQHCSGFAWLGALLTPAAVQRVQQCQLTAHNMHLHAQAHVFLLLLVMIAHCLQSTLMGYDLVLWKEPGTEGRWSCPQRMPTQVAPASLGAA